ncbi:MAG: hypothetical protein OEM15_06695 [Myxococcales bacterium]|nr:hypothetical protein [Myxococcales bacterium]MDH3483360.1 hypothetical protein [Myxococcales bacterium]
MAVSEEKLSELEEALAELGKDDDEVSAVLRRFEGGEPADLAAVDGELDGLADGASIAPILREASSVDAQDRQHSEPAHEAWDGENTEVEIIDPSDDFVLLVDEDDLEELERAAVEVPNVTVPPPLPGQKVAQKEDDEEDEGFFKKLFGSRRSSNRP